MDIYIAPSVDGFDCVLLNEALKRFHVKPQRSPHLHARKLPQPGFLVDGVHLQAQIRGNLLDIQEPLTDRSIRPHFWFCGHPVSPLVRCSTVTASSCRHLPLNRFSICLVNALHCHGILGGRKENGISLQEARSIPRGVSIYPADRSLDSAEFGHHGLKAYALEIRAQVVVIGVGNLAGACEDFKLIEWIKVWQSGELADRSDCGRKASPSYLALDSRQT